jgi:hypothetical protein
LKTYIVIGDSHAKPGVNNNRFSILGKMIVDVKPDVLIQMGDLYDMESLCSYDKGKKSFEGRRYRNDISAGDDAMERISHEMKKSKFNCDKEALEGNHENRAERCISLEPQLEGIVGVSGMSFADHGWNLTRYEGSSPGLLVKDQIAFAHFHVTGIMQRPISGEHPAYQMIMKRHMSCVGGHSHLVDYAERNRADGRRIQGAVVGCFLDPRQFEEYAGSANWMWNRGIMIFRDVYKGTFDMEWVSMKRIFRTYA